MSDKRMCNICCETFNKSKHLPVKCQYCSFEACRMCVQTYLTQDDVREPVCMNPSCGRTWIYEFLQENMYKSFLNNDYKKHREKQLFQQELSFLPVTQLELEKDIKIEEIADQIREKQEAIKQLKEDILDLHFEVTRLRNGSVAKAERREFVRACPAEDCRGFLSTQWKCGICKVNVCKDCHEIKADDTEHTCKQEVLESARLLAKETKNCPKCAAAIFKREGCDQMFCTMCHTAFSWNTLKIVNGRIHNPHYYEWLRSQAPDGQIPREPGDNPCGVAEMRQLPDQWSLQQKFRTAGLHSNRAHTFDGNTDVGKFWLIYRMIAHITDVEMLRYPAMQPLDVNANMDIRKRYMRNVLTKEEFQTLLQQREKKRQKCNEFNQIMTMFTQVCSERIWQVANMNPITHTGIAQVIRDIEPLRVYFNNTCELVSKRYSCVCPYLNEDWQITSVKA